MAGLKKNFTHDGLNGYQRDMQDGKYAGIQLTITGTNATGQTGTLEDLGRVVLTRNGQPRVNRNPKKFADIQDIRGGKFTYSSTEAGAFQAVVYIPFFEKGHPNVFDIKGNDRFNYEWVPAGNASTVFDSLEIKVNGDMSPALIERYDYFINGADQDFSAAQSADDVPLNKRNVSAIYIEDVDNTVDSLSFNSNGKQVISTNDWLSLQGYTNANNRIEDETQDVIEIENHTPGIPGTLRNRNNVLTFTTSGAGAVDITVCSIIPGPNF